MAEDDGKRDKSSVGYSPSKGADRCGACAFFIAGGRCRRVKGEIDPGYWCDLFKAKR